MFGMKTKQLEEQVAKLTSNYVEQAKRHERQIEDLMRAHKIANEETTREIARLKDAEAILKKKFDEERALAFKTMELEFKGKMQDEVNKVRTEAQEKVNRGIEENFAKLKDSLAKLHEEGNAQTKFTEQIALKMMETIKPVQKVIEG